MWAIISIIFLFLYFFMCYYIVKRGFNVFFRPASRVVRISYWTISLLLVLLFPISQIIQINFRTANMVWMIVSGYYLMVAVSYAFLMILFVDLVRVINKSIPIIPTKVKDYKKTPIVLGIFLITVITILLIYGSFNAKNPVVTKYNLDIEKSGGTLRELNLIMVSDIHYGEIINISHLENMVQTINNLQPDIILLAGDITDGVLRVGESKKLSDVLSRMNAKYGKFAIPGNHDRELRNDNSQLSCYLSEAGIKVLKDNYLKVEDSFYVIGRNDVGHGSGQIRKEVKEIIKEVDSSKPLILLNHQPVDLENSQVNKIDLQLSGHTHKGQVFPISLITGKIFEMDWGVLKKGDFYLIVSSGFGTWGPPLRLGTKSEIVNVKVNFLK